MLSPFSYVQLFATPWTVACQTHLPMGFSRQEYWTGLPCSPPGDPPNPGVEPKSPASPALQADSLLLSYQQSPHHHHTHTYIYSFLNLFPLWFITGCWIQFPVLYRRTLLVTHPVCNSLHLLTPNSHSIPPPPLLPLDNHKSVLYVCEYVSVS